IDGEIHGGADRDVYCHAVVDTRRVIEGEILDVNLRAIDEDVALDPIATTRIVLGEMTREGDGSADGADPAADRPVDRVGAWVAASGPQQRPRRLRRRFAPDTDAACR